MAQFKKIAEVFQFSDMVGMKRTFVHNFGIQYPNVIVREESGKQISSSNYRLKSLGLNSVQLETFYEFPGKWVIEISAGKMIGSAGEGSRVSYTKKIIQFTDASLIDGFLSTTHNFGTRSLYIKLFNNQNVEQNIDNFEWEPINEDSIKVDLRNYGTIEGTWTLYIRKW